mgnify:CR=1 FL=1
MVTAPGLYRIRLHLVMSIAATPDLTLSIRKGGTVVAGQAKIVHTCVSGAKANLLLEVEVQVNATDIPAGGGVNAFDDPPAGGVVGAGFAPKSGIAIDVVAKASTGTPTLTVYEGSFAGERLA